jgi:hypothetical protein
LLMLLTGFKYLVLHFFTDIRRFDLILLDILTTNLYRYESNK